MVVGTKQESNQTNNKRDPELTRRRLLDAATKLFAEKGRDGTSIDDICQYSGVNCRMIYHYYGSKEGLYMAMLASVYGRIREITMHVDQDTLTLSDYVETLTERYFRFLQANPEFVAILRWENASGAEGIRQLDMMDFRDQTVGAATRALELPHGETSFLEKSSGTSLEKGMLIILTLCSLCGYFFSNQASMSHILGVDLTCEEYAEKWLSNIKKIIQACYCE